MKSQAQEFAKRLIAAMKKAGLEPKPAVLEREFNLRYMGRPVTLHGARRWLLGETTPTQDKLLVLADMLHIEPQFLLFGNAPAKQVREKEARWENAISYHEREIFEAFLELSSPQKKIIREIIQAFHKSSSVKS
jgi:hypothetical protein